MGDARLRTIGVVTTARSDYGIYLPVLRALESEPSLHLRIIAGGMHLAPEYGNTVEAIERDGFRVADRVEMLLSSDTPVGTAKSIGLGVLGFSESYVRSRPDILLVLGDRFEMHAAALAALPFGIPLAHVHGGEVTEGAIDDALRHGITKMAHLHFASTQAYADRLIRMGEEPWRITVSGAPSLDNLRSVALLTASQLKQRFGVDFEPAPLLVTFHPVTRELDRTAVKIEALLEALSKHDLPIVFTLPNADPGGRLITQRIRNFAAAHENAHILDNLGTQAYFSIMRLARAMVGNSSSGIIEAASFTLPVVNVGRRQQGRIHGANVINVSDDERAAAIEEAIGQAVSPAFRSSLDGLQNPYGTGNAAAAIVARLRDVPIDSTLVSKRFFDA